MNKSSGRNGIPGKEKHSGQMRSLRRRAEEIVLANVAVNKNPIVPDTTHQLIHDLQVHQIELEMQNEELQRTQAELEASRARYFDLYDLAPIGYFTLSEKGLILETNLAVASLLGEEKSSLINQPFTRFIVPEDQDLFYLHRKQLSEMNAPLTWDIQLVKKDGTVFWGHLEAISAYDSDNERIYRIVVTDVTVRKHAQAMFQHSQKALETAHFELKRALTREQQLAHTDDLTGLCNRRHFFELAAREFDAAVRYLRPLTIFMFDVDDFKQVNDTHGHMVGDQVLMRVAKVAATHIRTVDVLARYGGDEFVILLPETSAQQALPMAERIRESVAARFREGEVFGITTSIGIAELRNTPEETSIESIVQRADKAMYLAKANGRNRIMTCRRKHLNVNYSPNRRKESRPLSSCMA